MKRNFLKYISFAALTLFVIGCKPGDFGDLNVSENSPSQPQTNLLFTNAERNMAGVVSSLTGRMFTQQNSETLYTSESRYNLKIYSYAGTYSNPLQDLALIIKLNTDAATKAAPNVIGNGTNANQIAAARILKAFFFQSMTDRWGDIPYSEALQGLSKATPKFDKQQAIYTDLFKELKEASAQFDATTVLKGDFLFGGSVAKWKKFANQIRLNMALRLSKVDPATGKTEFNLALAAGVLASNADNVSYPYLAESANENNMYNNYNVAKRYDFTISKTLLDYLQTNSDPRLGVYAERTAPLVNGVNTGPYVGMPFGITQAAASAYSIGGFNTAGVFAAGSVSAFGTKFRQQNSVVTIFTYAETKFAIAEAYKLGWITGVPDDVNAALNYNDGVTASLSQHGAAAPAIATYLAQVGIAYDPANAVKQIITQKWVANYEGYGFEAWADWRRTGFPTLSPSPNPQNLGGQIPRRLCYTADEPSLNKTNYLAVVASQGPDELSTRVWWDKP
ncbi:SusD/RagB family nutrient-binding outer membrane lipoprotein [Pedobacter sp. LMG 31464]|uniref:SusD/RagB family nutrient-binding outer membrane lipoprotein n=1 Tax=Pedobacter planticolens TaxID=2679964 RepID=A0A923IVH3_9SPHI|nr:SusD/RagB family nutrient-binding outer membrane lipoprotein [Pedobacter planticolens]MBB2146026.1 SusD/RagB family nutrient-binding outer membrane lipoprotein [Pedobacter planticolens]